MYLLNINYEIITADPVSGSWTAFELTASVSRKKKAFFTGAYLNFF